VESGVPSATSISVLLSGISVLCLARGLFVSGCLREPPSPPPSPPSRVCWTLCNYPRSLPQASVKCSTHRMKPFFMELWEQAAGRGTSWEDAKYVLRGFKKLKKHLPLQSTLPSSMCYHSLALPLLLNPVVVGFSLTDVGHRWGWSRRLISENSLLYMDCRISSTLWRNHKNFVP